jgi:putative endonuclease
MLASNKNGTLYIGVTNNLMKRVPEHKRKEFKGFTEKYDVDKLVWFDETSYIGAAIKREKELKKWLRKWKVTLIEKTNPEWKDLFYEIGGNDEMLLPEFKIM